MTKEPAGLQLLKRLARGVSEAEGLGLKTALNLVAQRHFGFIDFATAKAAIDAGHNCDGIKPMRTKDFIDTYVAGRQIHEHVIHICGGRR